MTASPPRPLTAKARRRSWNERPVRVWLILALLIALATSYFAVRDIGAAMRDRRLVRDGLLVPATIEVIDSYARPERVFSRESPHHLRVQYFGGNSTNASSVGDALTAELEAPATSSADSIAVGQQINIRVDPKDATNVTLRTVPVSWLESLAVVIIFAIALSIVLAVTFWQRSRVLSVWQNGRPAVAVVVDFHHAGIAPRSRVLRFTIVGESEDEAENDDPADQRIFSALWPTAAGDLQAGDEIEILLPEGSSNGDRALARGLYE